MVILDQEGLAASKQGRQARLISGQRQRGVERGTQQAGRQAAGRQASRQAGAAGRDSRRSDEPGRESGASGRLASWLAGKQATSKLLSTWQHT